MPLYTFEDEHTKLRIEVMRDYDSYQIPPTDEELPESERGKERKWKKLISPGIRTTKAAGWGPGKGYWMRHEA